MQQQLQQLKDKLNTQKIVNDQLLRNSCKNTINRLRFKANSTYLFALVAVLCVPGFIHTAGLSIAFAIYTVAMLLVAVIATIYCNQFLPRNMDKDLVTVAENLQKYKKLDLEWPKIAGPMLAVWIIWMIWEFFKQNGGEGYVLYILVGGVAVGLVIGLGVGLKIRRDRLDAADELLSQIEELKRMK
jgi:hypothetical protein